MTINPDLTEMVRRINTAEQEKFHNMLASTVTWEVHHQGRIRFMSERAANLLSVHLPTEVQGYPDFQRVQLAFKSLMGTLPKAENPILTLAAMKAGLRDAITRLEILENALINMEDEAA